MKNGLSLLIVGLVLSACSGGTKESQVPQVPPASPTPVNNAPTISIEAESVISENVSLNARFVVNDANNDTLSIVLGGVDAASFVINNDEFLDFTITPDFEMPTDTDRNNVYEVELTVSDGRLSDSVSLAIEVINDVSDDAPTPTTNTIYAFGEQFVTSNSPFQPATESTVYSLAQSFKCPVGTLDRIMIFPTQASALSNARFGLLVEVEQNGSLHGLATGEVGNIENQQSRIELLFENAEITRDTTCYFYISNDGPFNLLVNDSLNYPLSMQVLLNEISNEAQSLDNVRYDLLFDVLYHYQEALSGDLDIDRDLILNRFDDDMDGDGALNSVDDLPTDPNETLDTDGDGIGNNQDSDDDNDAVMDEMDAFPFDSTESLDTDSDGVGNNQDSDDDNDGVLDEADDFPLDPSRFSDVDTDGDGVENRNDDDDDNDGIADDTDNCPLISNALQQDSNNNGVGDSCETLIWNTSEWNTSQWQ